MTEEKSIAVSLLEKTIEKLQGENHVLQEQIGVLEIEKSGLEDDVRLIRDDKQRVEASMEAQVERLEKDKKSYFYPENLDHQMKLELLEEVDILNKYNYLQLKELLGL